MTRREGKRLKIGDRVDIWRGTPQECSGTVTETGYSAVKFTWDDGVVGVIHMDDLTNVARLEAAP